jgi:sigma-E factor negative regulatory protein RseA
MSEKLKESLSAVMDGEADEFEIKRVLNEASSNPDLKTRWHRYHLIGAVLRSELAGQDGPSAPRVICADPEHLLARIWRDVESDAFDVTLDADGNERAAATDGRRAAATAPAVAAAASSATGDGPRARRGWFGPLTGVGVAASVALAVVIGFGGNEGPMPAEQSYAATPAGLPAPAFTAARAVTDRHEIEGPSQADRHRMQAYMLHHVHHTSLNNQASVVPFVKVAAFEPR